MQGIEFLRGENSSTMHVGVCIIDTTHKGIIPSSWSAIQFGNIIDRVCGIAHQPYKFVIASLIKYQDGASLEKAILEKVGWYEMHDLPLACLIALEIVKTSAL